jgi:hypothetical protein
MGRLFTADHNKTARGAVCHDGPERASGDSPGLSEARPWVTIPPGPRPVGAHESNKRLESNS